MITRSLKVVPKPVFTAFLRQYTVSPEQKKFYADNGYLSIKELIEATSLDKYKQRFVQICKGLVDRGNITIVKEPPLVAAGVKGEDAVNKLQDILFDDVFSQYFEDPRLLHVVSQLIPGDTKKIEDVNLMGMHTMFINKPPGTTPHPPHQDLYYFPFRPAHKIVAAWTAVDHVTQENGCLYVVPGSHKLEKIYAHANSKDEGKALYHGVLEEESVAPMDKRVHFVMSPGDTIFFHPLLVHGSGPNVTKTHRKSISCHYANGECYYIDVSDSAQAQIAEEIVAAVSKKFGFSDITVQEIFKYRSKQVKGTKSNL
ncbi:phytanoyl-CoA dioxygenase, peroxisomal-like [Hyposmocoma kahamanoa]|uniref:phytanoyl-CoA dioxygenase, peroxisomal-like n=1 Tax=Hyposmocoma kahamanoa TaxID=1477025 RepID=UPI000E6D6A54|nr:phytanoyl-CoA dioxygenase, peroxisomal-like [Hyposmocoma kahamanoa]